MARAIVEQWHQKIPAIERNQPLVILDGTAYTPNQVLDEVRRGTPLGDRLQGVIEARQFTDVLDKYALAVTRLKERLSAAGPDFEMVVGTQSYTADQLMKEIQDGTPIGRRLIEAEVRRMAEVVERA